MSIGEGDFHRLADQTLQALVDALDDGIGDVADVDLQGGIATVAFDDGRNYVINKHVPTRQIWLSSPVSGAWHFQWDERASRWCSTRDPAVDLNGLLGGEIAAITGYTLGF